MKSNSTPQQSTPTMTTDATGHTVWDWKKDLPKPQMAVAHGFDS
jgi:hypothetical protein